MPHPDVTLRLMSILDLFAQHCACCNQPGPALCRSCRFALASSQASHHEVSDHSAHGVHAALPFDGVARSAILSLKYRNRRPVAAHLARLMVSRLHLDAAGARRFDVVTWAPTSTARIRNRGYDQAELLAREVARRIGVPCRRLLYRSHSGHELPQTGRDRDERLGHGGPAFRSRTVRPGVRVLVVDDVVTTGGTLVAAAAALRAAGIDHITLVAAAATPRMTRRSERPVLLPAIDGVDVRLRPAGRLTGGVRNGSVPRLRVGAQVGSTSA